jgi:hypothetical protein
MRLTGRESEMDRQAIGVHDRVNLVCQAPSRATHILVIVVRHTGSVLVHADDAGINHLHRRVMTDRKRNHDLVPDASPSPPNEAIVTGSAGTIGRWQVALWRTTAQNPKDAIEHATVIYTPNAARLVGQYRHVGSPFIIAEFIAHDSNLPLRSLNQIETNAFNGKTG